MNRLMLCLTVLSAMASMPVFGQEMRRPLFFVHSPGATYAHNRSSVALGGLHFSPLRAGRFHAGLGMMFDGKQGDDPGRWPGFLTLPVSYRFTRSNRGDEWDASVSYARSPHVSGSILILGISYGISRRD